jgi:hypothetical protein
MNIILWSNIAKGHSEMIQNGGGIYIANGAITYVSCVILYIYGSSFPILTNEPHFGKLKQNDKIHNLSRFRPNPTGIISILKDLFVSCNWIYSRKTKKIYFSAICNVSAILYFSQNVKLTYF